MNYKIFVEHTSLFILGACFLVYLINVLGAWKLIKEKTIISYP